MRKIKIGIVGYSTNDFDVEKAKSFLDEIFKQIQKEYFEVEIVSGFTNTGVPKIAYELAKEYSFKTIGFSAKQAYDYETFPVDEVIIIGKNFGEESVDFIKYIDRIIRAGGRKQSFAEVQLFRESKKNLKSDSVIEFDL
ncbi:hypothetical protein [Aureivirga sp. CE67]|uniref:hypothetical protein n=1 Tax=Aureivirga sp. CE67 TaxID=1788983 RepID=UPI0018C9BB48|nr:hypothetical protein [Aureivirga sp. CE67]